MLRSSHHTSPSHRGLRASMQTTGATCSKGPLAPIPPSRPKEEEKKRLCMNRTSARPLVHKSLWCRILCSADRSYIPSRSSLKPRVLRAFSTEQWHSLAAVHSWPRLSQQARKNKECVTSYHKHLARSQTIAKGPSCASISNLKSHAMRHAAVHWRRMALSGHPRRSLSFTVPLCTETKLSRKSALFIRRPAASLPDK